MSDDAWGSNAGSEHELKVGSEAGSDKSKPEKVTYEPEYDAIDDEDLYKTGLIKSGIDFEKYFEIKVKVTGTGADDIAQIEKFEDMNLDPGLLNNIKRCQWDKPTPIQRHSIPIVMAKRDLMGCAQTGSGKTGGFAIPIINSLLKDGCEAKEKGDDDDIAPEALIVAPTRELVQQIHRDCVKLLKDTKISSQFICGGHAVRQQLDNLERGVNILVATPGRLDDFVGKNKIKLENLKFLVLDEADRMLDMGFKSKLDDIASKMPDKADRTTMLFSATFPEKVQNMGNEMMKDDYLFAAVGFVGGANVSVTQTILAIPKKEQFKHIKEIAEGVKNSGNKTLIFVETKRQADFIASKLCQMKFPSTSIHGDRQQQEREEALASFKSGETPILIATSVASRGLDIPDVQHVVNMEMPKEIDEYVHRIGRTGRCGHKGKATSFYDEDKDSDIAGDLVKILTDAQQVIPDFLADVAVGGASAEAGDAGGDDDDDEEGW